MKLPKELIEDYEKGVQVTDLCKKYELSRHIIRNQLGIRKGTWGGRRKGCGRKKSERGEELKKIREQNAKISCKHKQPKGSKVKRSSLYSVVRTGYYTGGWE